MKSEKGSSVLIDLHAHSMLSDGVLLPSELVRRYEVAGFKAVAITDHVDSSNMGIVLSGLTRVCKELNKYWKIRAIPGVELTHLPLQLFRPMVKEARKRGARIVVAHGESPVEPVIKGTNKAAILAGVDILAHPGKISIEDAMLAQKRGVLLEITSRRGHSKTNTHVASVAKKAGAGIILDSDSHIPEDIPSAALFKKTAGLAGISKDSLQKAFENSENLLKGIIRLT
ncbi:MAG: histidinol phosphate phosphatase domain-containing protein [Candidatus Omnitrophica bacterium]|nr:histidinol phosphate phosphatase domain-containing protein [Candidatus Omnitrophota bacterium]